MAAAPAGSPTWRGAHRGCGRGRVLRSRATFIRHFHPRPRGDTQGVRELVQPRPVTERGSTRAPASPNTQGLVSLMKLVGKPATKSYGSSCKVTAGPRAAPPVDRGDCLGVRSRATCPDGGMHGVRPCSSSRRTARSAMGGFAIFAGDLVGAPGHGQVAFGEPAGRDPGSCPGPPWRVNLPERMPRRRAATRRPRSCRTPVPAIASSFCSMSRSKTLHAAGSVTRGRAALVGECLCLGDYPPAASETPR